MNTLMLVALAVVALCYCGGKYCPKVLSSNKEMLLGVLVGVALCSFADLRMEGMTEGSNPQLSELPPSCCTNSNEEECKRFSPHLPGNNLTMADLINRCSEISP